MELLIARSLGANSFLVYTAIKQGNKTSKELSVATGVSTRGLRNILPKLLLSNVIFTTKVIHERGMYFLYGVNESNDWTLQ
jgi:hypothetical protein